jgi:hypothetical protein
LEVLDVGPKIPDHILHILSKGSIVPKSTIPADQPKALTAITKIREEQEVEEFETEYAGTVKRSPGYEFPVGYFAGKQRHQAKPATKDSEQ